MQCLYLGIETADNLGSTTLPLLAMYWSRENPTDAGAVGATPAF